MSIKPFTKPEQTERVFMQKVSVFSGTYLVPGQWVGFAFILLILCGSVALAQTTLVTKPGKSTAGDQNASTSGMPTRQAASVLRTAPAAPVQVNHQSPVERLGGILYSTGTEDVIVKILERSRPSTLSGAATNSSGLNSGIYLVSTTPERFIGFSFQGRKVVNLGKLPAGELVFAIKTPEQRVFQTGPSSRNPDGLEHAMTRSFPSGTIEVWFEDLNKTGDRDFNDVVIQLTGGIADNSAVADLLKIIKEQKGEVRDEAIRVLKVINPKAVAQAGLKVQ